MQKNILKGELKAARAHPYVREALDGNVKAAKLFTGPLNSKCVTPNNKFNAVTAAMQLLRFQPNRVLIKDPITSEYEAGSLENILTGILNDTIDRKLGNDFVQFSESPRPLYNFKALDYCHDAERNFMHSAFYQMESRNKIYIDEEGDPVFLKKFIPRGVESALSFQPINFNGVELPPGTIVDLRECRSELELPDLGRLAISSVKSDGLKNAYPLRLSSFALNPKDRRETFGLYDQRLRWINDPDKDVTLEDMKELLPKSQILLGHLAVQSEVPNIKYAA